jgi:hypothetical protein
VSASVPNRSSGTGVGLAPRCRPRSRATGASTAVEAIGLGPRRQPRWAMYGRRDDPKTPVSLVSVPSRHLDFRDMRKPQSRDHPRSEGDRQLAYQRAVEEAFHPRSDELRQGRAPRYGTYRRTRSRQGENPPVA